MFLETTQRLAPFGQAFLRAEDPAPVAMAALKALGDETSLRLVDKYESGRLKIDFFRAGVFERQLALRLKTARIHAPHLDPFRLNGIYFRPGALDVWEASATICLRSRPLHMPWSVPAETVLLRVLSNAVHEERHDVDDGSGLSLIERERNAHADKALWAAHWGDVSELRRFVGESPESVEMGILRHVLNRYGPSPSRP